MGDARRLSHRPRGSRFDGCLESVCHWRFPMSFASATASGRELIESRTFLDTCEASWLALLAESDARGDYLDDGHSSCVSWLVDKLRLGPVHRDGQGARGERVDEASGSRRRFHLRRVAVCQGPSLDAPRGLDDIRDAKYVRYAATDTQDDLERRSQRWNYHENQDRKPGGIDDKAGIPPVARVRRRARHVGDRRRANSSLSCGSLLHIRTAIARPPHASATAARSRSGTRVTARLRARAGRRRCVRSPGGRRRPIDRTRSG